MRARSLRSQAPENDTASLNIVQGRIPNKTMTSLRKSIRKISFPSVTQETQQFESPHKELSDNIPSVGTPTQAELLKSYQIFQKSQEQEASNLSFLSNSNASTYMQSKLNISPKPSL